jgi:hypothetical protein
LARRPDTAYGQPSIEAKAARDTPSRAAFSWTQALSPPRFIARPRSTRQDKLLDLAVTDFCLDPQAPTSAETLAAMDASGRLLLEQAREAKARADRLEIALSLVVGVVANDPDLEEGLVLQRIAGQLRLCADLPEMAAELVGCEIGRIDAAMLRAAAAIIGAAGKPEPEALSESPTVH